MNKDGWEKDTDARRWRRCIDDRWRGIIRSFPMAIVAIITAVVVIPTPSVIAVIPTPSMLVTAFVMFIVFGEGRRHVYTADHCG
jgi:hypothetical protein